MSVPPTLTDLPLPASAALALRLWSLDDVPAMTAACRDEHTQRWTLVPADYTEAHAREFVPESTGRFHRAESAELAITRPGDPAVVLGAVGLMAIDWRARTAEVGYWIAPEHRRQGIATSAVALASEWGFAALGLARIYLKPIRGNRASEAVALAAGYEFQGTHHEVDMPKRGPTDVLIYARCATMPG